MSAFLIGKNLQCYFQVDFLTYHDIGKNIILLRSGQVRPLSIRALGHRAFQQACTLPLNGISFREH